MAGPWAAVVETHTAALFFAGDLVFKVKKPVALDFVDLTTMEDRRRACDAEVSLNRRLAPDVYLGVAELALPSGPLEHAVVMRRLPAHLSLSARIDACGEQLDESVADLAGLLANFHQRCPRVGVELPRELWAPPIDLWREEISRCAALHADQLPTTQLHRALCLAERYADERRELFVSRLDLGLVREGHGDLLADDIYMMPDGPRVLDCLEFDQRLRICDVLHDLSFLVMDLEHRDRQDLADVLVRRYGALMPEQHPATLLHFFVAHRALIRAKVHAIRAEQRGDAVDGAPAALLALALRHLEEAQVRLVLLGGLPGAGKTTLAGQLASRLPAVHLSSDRIRDELAPADSELSGFDSGRYQPSITDAVYAEMLRRAVVLLRAGEHVVLDASWQSEARRAAAARAVAEAGAVTVEIEATADESVAVQRLVDRPRVRGGSEATVEVRQEMRRRFAPWQTATQVATTHGTGEAMEAVMAAIRVAGIR